LFEVIAFHFILYNTTGLFEPTWVRGQLGKEKERGEEKSSEGIKRRSGKERRREKKDIEKEIFSLSERWCLLYPFCPRDKVW
jgi:hypothetical protein